MAAPRSRSDLFWTFQGLALQGFGGVLAIVQRELVERKRWISQEQFVEDWAVAQVLPGPNVVNLSLMIGARHFGGTGALAAVAGMLLAPLALVLLLAAAFSAVAENPVVVGAVRGMGVVAAGLNIAAGLRLASALESNVMGRWACWGLAACTLAAVAGMRWPLPWVLLGLGGLATAWAWVQLGRRSAADRPTLDP